MYPPTLSVSELGSMLSTKREIVFRVPCRSYKAVRSKMCLLFKNVLGPVSCWWCPAKQSFCILEKVMFFIFMIVISIFLFLAFVFH